MHHLVDGIGDVERRLVAHAIELELDRGVLVELGVEVALGEAVADRGDVAERDRGTGLVRHDLDLGELIGPLLARLDPQQDLAGARLHRTRRDVLTRALDDPGNFVEGQPVLAQALARDLDMGHVVRHA